MSKFDFEVFSDGYDTFFAVSKQRYGKEEAVEVAIQEMGDGKPLPWTIEDGFVRHRAGRDDEGNPRVCWWLEDDEHKRSCPCWVFHW